MKKPFNIEDTCRKIAEAVNQITVPMCYTELQSYFSAKRTPSYTRLLSNLPLFFNIKSYTERKNKVKSPNYLPNEKPIYFKKFLRLFEEQTEDTGKQDSDKQRKSGKPHTSHEQMRQAVDRLNGILNEKTDENKQIEKPTESCRIEQKPLTIEICIEFLKQNGFTGIIEKVERKTFEL